MFNKSVQKNVRNFDKWLREHILENKIVSSEKLLSLEKESKDSNLPFHHILNIKDVLHNDALLELANKVLTYKVVNLEEITISNEAFNALPKSIINKYKIIPIELQSDSNKIIIAMSDPSNLMATDEIRRVTKLNPVPLFALHSQIIQLLEQNENQSDINSIIEEMNNTSIDIDNNEETQDAIEDNNSNDEPVVVRMVNSILSEAINSNASDIHIEPMENYIKIRFRVDGILIEKIKSLDKQFLNPMVSRIKVLSNLDISENRRPQDGRFRIRTSKGVVDIRVSTMGTQFGEKIVMRLTNRSMSLTSIESLGFNKEESITIKNVASKPYGLILVTGPTGSGKSTTLYGMLNYLNVPDKNIVTVEDPIERQINGVIQTSVNNKAEITFATGLRTILRQDPDIIMVGEIRDKETAEMAIQAALTGHLVLSTLHTNDASGAITRLMDMGVDSYKIPSSLLLTIAQRLIRVNCPNCKTEYKPSLEDIQLMRSVAPDIDIPDDVTLYKGIGCKKCSNTGYKGRQGVFEMLTMNEDIKELTLKGESSTTIKQKAIDTGMKTMEVRGMERVLDGTTTLEEIKRVIFI